MKIKNFNTLLRSTWTRLVSNMSENPTVKITEGILKGRLRSDLENQSFLSFEGIPYAEPPVGPLRFKPPVPVKPWAGIKEVLKKDDGNFCKNMVFNKNDAGEVIVEFPLAGSEDSLKLDVYTRSVQNGVEKKPVMVFIHGGAYTMGNTKKYGPEHLIHEDIVLVMIQYRLGAFGFLVLEDSKLGVTGNAALKDMILALKWVQKNISFFNGDPGNVTVFGQSAGAAAVNSLVLSPMSSGLFHKAIIQSGCSINYWAFGSRNNGVELAKILGFASTNDEEILEFLQSLTTEEIYEAQLKLGDVFSSSRLRPFGPVVENADSENAFLTEHPIDLITSGKFNRVPIMIGYTDMESIPLLIEHEGSPFNVEFSKESILVPFVLGLHENSSEFNEVARKVKQFYFGNSEIDLISPETIICTSDLFIIRGLLKTAEHMRKSSSEPVFLYRFRTPFINSPPFSTKNITGVPHSGEMFHLFNHMVKPNHVAGNEEIVRKWFIRLWTNFARYGKPTVEHERDQLICLEWKPVDENLDFLDIEDELKMGVHPEHDRMKFWDELFRLYPHADKY